MLPIDASCYEVIDSPISQYFFHTSKCTACNAEKTLGLK